MSKLKFKNWIKKNEQAASCQSMKSKQKIRFINELTYLAFDNFNYKNNHAIIMLVVKSY